MTRAALLILFYAAMAAAADNKVYPHGRKLDVGGGTPWEKESALIVERILGRFDRNLDKKLVLSEFNSFLEAIGCKTQTQSEFFGLLSACPFLARKAPAQGAALHTQRMRCGLDAHCSAVP